MYVVFVVCFLPYICVKAAYRIYGESELRLHLLYYSTTLVYLRACLHGGGGPQVGEVTRLGGVTRLSI